MPIYAYKCDSCGFAKDVLRKISDQPLTQCPSCQAEAFKKQVTAAGFQLKGSGWYATDFKGGGAKPAETGEAKSAESATPKTESATSEGAKSTSSDSASTTPATAPAAKKVESTPSSSS